MDKVVHFEIPAVAVNRAKEFYSKVFGWEINAMDKNYFLVTTTPVDDNWVPKEPGGINGGIAAKSEKFSSIQIVVNVDSIDNTVKKIQEEGGKLIQEKQKIEHVGFYARVKDSEGNIIGLIENFR